MTQYWLSSYILWDLSQQTEFYTNVKGKKKKASYHESGKTGKDLQLFFTKLKNSLGLFAVSHSFNRFIQYSAI